LKQILTNHPLHSNGLGQGGPFGCESAVRYGGTFYALLGFVVLPFVWSVPEALVTAELGSAYPEPAGGVVWVEKAFGETAAALAGYMTWVGGVVDNAIYPALFLDYVHSILGFNTVGTTRYLIVAAISIVLSTVNYMGLQIVGSVLVLVCIFSMSPFILLSLFGSFKIDPSRWMQMPDPSLLPPAEVEEYTSGLLRFPNFGGVIWRPFLNNLFWNLNAFDSAANFAGEVHEPGRVFPKAMFISLLMVFFSYIIPMLVATGATNSSQADWTEGYLATISSQVVGNWLGGWTVLASGVSNVALYEAEMSSDSFQLLGMAQRGMIPDIFARRSRFSTPTYGIIVGTIVVLIMNTADFSAIVEMLNFTYGISLLMEFAAFVKLRRTHGNGECGLFSFSIFVSVEFLSPIWFLTVHRPYRIPLNTFGCFLFVMPPVVMTMLLMAMASTTTFIFFIAVLAFGAFAHFMRKEGKKTDIFGSNLSRATCDTCSLDDLSLEPEGNSSNGELA